MTKKKHSITTIDDIKYCEEHGIELYDDYQATVCLKFVDGVWCGYTNKNLKSYNVKLSLNSLYYYEEQEQQEATYDDIGKLCWFYTDEEDGEKSIGVLTKVPKKKGGSGLYEMDKNYYYQHCRRLTPSEVAEVTGYKVEEK